jgi:pyruvate, water dikinase
VTSRGDHRCRNIHGHHRPFADLSREDFAFAGGKGANLGELTRARLPVPSGFVVGAAAYAKFCDHGSLRRRLAGALEGLACFTSGVLQPGRIVDIALIDQEPLPPDLEREIRAAYSSLGADAAVAVRSSATAEDTEDASFAGMNETFLNVRGAGAGRRSSARAPSSTAPRAGSARQTWTSPSSSSVRWSR